MRHKSRRVYPKALLRTEGTAGENRSKTRKKRRASSRAGGLRETAQTAEKKKVQLQNGKLPKIVKQSPAAELERVCDVLGGV